jgi:hypothetical protein
MVAPVPLQRSVESDPLVVTPTSPVELTPSIPEKSDDPVEVERSWVNLRPDDPVAVELISSFAHGVAVPIPTLPVDRIVIFALVHAEPVQLRSEKNRISQLLVPNRKVFPEILL